MFSNIKLYKLSLSELLKATTEIYKAKFLQILIVTIAVFLPMYSILAIIPQQYSLEKTFKTFTLATTTAEQMSVIGPLYIALGIVLLLQLIYAPLCQGGIVYIVNQHINKSAVSVSGVLDSTVSKWLNLFFANAMITLINIITSITIIFPIFFAIRYSFISYSVALNNKNSIEALKESSKLVKNNWWITLLYKLFVGMFTFVISVAMGSLLGNTLSNNNQVEIVIVQTISQLITSFGTIFFAILFINRICTYEEKNANIKIENK